MGTPTHKAYVDEPGLESETTFIEDVRIHLSAGLEVLDSWTIRLPKFAARSDEEATATIDISSFWLPSNGVYPNAQPLSMKPRFAACLTLAASAYWNVATAQKSRATRVKLVISTLAKFLEYAWMKDKFDLSDWRQEDFDTLARELAKGGWQYALRVKERLIDVCSNSTPQELAAFVRQDSGLKQRNLNTRIFRSRLGTNVQGQEVKIYHGALDALSLAAEQRGADQELVRSTLEKVAPELPSESTLREIFAILNYVYDLPLRLGFTILPYTNGHTYARKLGIPVGRTANLTAEQAASLFAESYRWIYGYGPSILELLSELCQSVIRAHHDDRSVLGFELDAVLRRSSSRQWLDQHLPVKISGVDAAGCSENSMSLRSAILCLMSAAFFLSATMNARRKDEISHRRFGLHRGCIQTVDHDLRLHEAEFYIEKTFCDYMSFYVNQATYDVVQLLERLQDQFDSVDIALGRRNPAELPLRERSLFTYRRLSRIEGVGMDRCWFNFEARTRGHAGRFVKFALGGDDVRITPHMFRRAYALIFYYRYSNATLQALSSQLRHHNLNTTMIYVTDPWFIADAAKIGKAFEAHSASRRHAFDLEINGLQKELRAVGDELLVETVLSILSGKPAIGGYVRFVKFIHSKIGSRLDYNSADLRQAAEDIASTLRQRGHAPTCFPHGQCMAGDTRSVHLARCSGPSKSGIQRENASPTTCSKCAYHYSNAAYLQNLKIDLVELESVASEGSTLEAVAAEKSAWNLRQLIRLHQSRLEKGA